MVEQKRFRDVLLDHRTLTTKDRLQELMEPDSYNDLVDAIHNEKISTGSIARALNAMGFDVSKPAIYRWRCSVKV